MRSPYNCWRQRIILVNCFVYYEKFNVFFFYFKKSIEKLSLGDGDCKMKKNCPINEDALDLDYTGKFSLPKAKLKNKSISDASEKIKIKVNSTFGRHIVAVKDIEIGTV